ncbi:MULTISPECIES: hypothetical protein [Spirosoma]|uniref:Uncharacterized protein n=1 Tax=Spirosoma liriopis TaxID=2937440 RepID=A0ABT0HRM1_9BACT|nr:MULTISPECIES: hypothetical protein [Spirosoma]MCK8494826.1 hypothetical protein [Spirosoma liriopis]UHG93955.1 hypothetical protein LQ777_24630 [Spirosoma oryzicola]
MNVLFTFNPNRVQSIPKQMDHIPQKGTGVHFSVETLKDASGELVFSKDEYNGVWFLVEGSQTIFTQDMNYYVEVILSLDED